MSRLEKSFMCLEFQTEKEKLIMLWFFFVGGTRRSIVWDLSSYFRLYENYKKQSKEYSHLDFLN